MGIAATQINPVPQTSPTNWDDQQAAEFYKTPQQAPQPPPRPEKLR
jgi:hypothetical protein